MSEFSFSQSQPECLEESPDTSSRYPKQGKVKMRRRDELSTQKYTAESLILDHILRKKVTNMFRIQRQRRIFERNGSTIGHLERALSRTSIQLPTESTKMMQVPAVWMGPMMQRRKIHIILTFHFTMIFHFSASKVISRASDNLKFILLASSLEVSVGRVLDCTPRTPHSKKA